MGRILGPHGVKGWVKIQPLTAEPDGLLSYTRWWLGRDDVWEVREIERAEVHHQTIAAKIAGSDDRDIAAKYRGMAVAVERAALPASAGNEYYWADLIGLKVVNGPGQELGEVRQVVETGANDVLVVQGERERLIPFIADVVRQVDLEGGRITVDWDADY
jgi:16S rRNA processing protein RimM